MTNRHSKIFYNFNLNESINSLIENFFILSLLYILYKRFKIKKVYQRVQNEGTIQYMYCSESFYFIRMTIYSHNNEK